MDHATGRIEGLTVHGHHAFEAPLISHIEGNLYQGGCDPTRPLPAGIIHVISLYPDEAYSPAPDQVSFLEVAVSDSLDQDLSVIDPAAHWALSCLETGPTLIHCHMGLNRSGVLAARVLMLQGATADEAIALLRARRSPAVLNNPAFESWLRSLSSPVSPLTPSDPLWPRLWARRHAGTSVLTLAPVPEITDPWPPASASPDTDLGPETDLPGPWERLRGGSRRSSVYHASGQVLRVARSPEHHTVIDREALSLAALAGDTVPSLLARGVGWLLRPSIDGERPTCPGPWVDELAAFVLRLRARDLPFLEPADYPEPTALALAAPDALEALLARAPYPPIPDLVVPVHGDLHAGNLLVDDKGHLLAVLDFESISLAPPERDHAIWVTVLPGQVGLAPLPHLSALLGPFSPDVLHAELVRLLELTARAADTPARTTTARVLAEVLAASPDLPASLL